MNLDRRDSHRNLKGIYTLHLFSLMVVCLINILGVINLFIDIFEITQNIQFYFLDNFLLSLG